MKKVRYHVFVSGRVQGVFFRESTRETADMLGLSGWVRNLRDGRVEAVFEGEEDNVARAIEFVRQGPEYARVSDVELIEEEVEGTFVEFRVEPSA